MSKVQIKKRGPSLDMTAMCDVAFLLLTFFILTTTFKKDEKVVVDTPSSTIDNNIPKSDVITVTIDSKNKVYFAMDKPIRDMVLDAIGAKSGIEFSAEEKDAFVNLDLVGVPVNKLKSYLALPEEDRAHVELDGIPIDSANNELGDWLLYARNASATLEIVPWIAIKGDGKASAKTTERVIYIFQEPPNLLTKFNFVTDLEPKPQGL